ncbi:hypothetical protein RB595_007941 [Gaeumannomyces hyphopodioides]
MANNSFKAGDTISTELKIHGVLYEIQADVLYDDEPDRLYQHIFVTPRRVLTKLASGAGKGTWENWNTDEDVQTSIAVERKSVWRIPTSREEGSEGTVADLADQPKDSPDDIQTAVVPEPQIAQPQQDEVEPSSEGGTGLNVAPQEQEGNTRRGKRASV